MRELEIRPLTRDRLPDLASLFGQGGDPKWCWCSFYRVRNVDFQSATAESNRKVLEGAVKATSAKGRHPGLIAYRDGEAIGWVSVGPREDYDRLTHSKVLAPLDDRPVWSIVCFVVSRKARKQGVAHALLEAAVDYAREHGATLLEAYPVETDGERVPAANVYKGTLRMFERAGFEVAARRRATPSSTPRPIVRRAVRRRGAVRRRRGAGRGPGPALRGGKLPPD
jgi:GNAT superfamily N-acetyltransferase